MKRIEHLVEKLNSQLAQKATLNQLLVTVQMLQKEITGSMREIDVLGSSGISVIAPVSPAPVIINTMEDTREPKEKEYFELVIETPDAEDEIPDAQNSILSYAEMVAFREETESAKAEKRAIQNFALPYDAPSEELPTLARQPKPISKVAKQAATPKVSRNSIKDLRKAISPKDRLIYVKELFRADETMFERSMQTINNFTSLEEAEYWIMRELKTKNGWVAHNPIVQQFEQLVKRRFG